MTRPARLAARSPAVLVALLLAAAACRPARADEDAPHLTIGDAAPPIDVAHWIKGVTMDPRGRFEPVTHFGDGRVYVLEFWATWCGPCRAGMPHLSEVQERFADTVTVIGVSDETLPKVVDFLFQTDRGDGKVENDRMRYVVATDPDASVKRDYFLAAGQEGIPCAFIIGRTGEVEWIGHPIRIDEPLQAVVAGTWDRAAFKVQFEKEQAVAKAMREARAPLQEATKAEDWDRVLGILDKLLEIDPASKTLRFRKLMLLIGPKDDPVHGYALGRKLVEDVWDDANLLNAISWGIVDDEAVKTRDLDLALQAAERAVEVSKGASGAILDTLARVHHDQGDLAEAIACQQRAVEAAGDTPMADELRLTLERYQKERDAASTEGGTR
jgi:thiol-disulfide isomerase/thioredoxin